MGSRAVKIIGAILALVGLLIFAGDTMAIWFSMLPAIQSTDPPRILAGYLYIAIAIAIVVGFIGVILGFSSKHSGGAWVLAMFIIILILYIIAITGLLTIDNSVYKFNEFKWIPAILLVAGAILMMVGQSKND